MKDNQVLDKILDWIVQEHDHHIEDEQGSCDCYDGEYPYVNSIELEKFVKSLKYESKKIKKDKTNV